MKKILCFLLFFSQSLFAKEVDPYYSLGVEIADSREYINRFMNLGIQKVLAQINYDIIWKNKNFTCEEVAIDMYNEMRWPTRQKIETYLTREAAVPKHPEHGFSQLKFYFTKSIFRRFTPPFFMNLSQTISVNGINFGIDKTGHFLSFGVKYYKRYLKLIKKHSHEEALDRIIKHGINSEKFWVGQFFTTVFSHGDLEANFQGLLSLIDFCTPGGENNLVLEDNQWSLEKPFDITFYVNPYWDEAFNPSIFSRSRWKSVQRYLMDYCHQFNKHSSQDQKSYYESFPKSQNILTVESLEEQGHIKKRSDYSIERVCQEDTHQFAN